MPEMSIRAASPLGQYSTLPAGGEGSLRRRFGQNSLPEPPKL
jgi:hypothetical protein